MKIDPNIEMPNYITKRGKLLWVNSSKYNAYSSAVNCKILRDQNGRFWGYSDNESLKEFKG